MDTTLLIHAVVAPLAFGLLTWNYFKRFPPSSAGGTALVMLGIVVGLDALVAAPPLERSYAMFRSVIGTWVPFAMKPEVALRAVRIGHTAIWAVFAGCILAVPIFSHEGRLEISSALIAVVSIEVLVIALNHWRCPLTNVAAGYTDDRSDNFDIFLPAWLARHNKLIFGTLYMAGSLYTLLVWVASRGAN